MMRLEPPLNKAENRYAIPFSIWDAVSSIGQFRKTKWAHSYFVYVCDAAEFSIAAS